MSKRKRGIRDRAVVQDYVNYCHGFLFSEVKDEKNAVLYSIPRRPVQALCRDVVRGVIIRRKEDKPVGTLLPTVLEVRDQRVILPDVGKSDTTDYARRLKEFFVAVYGSHGSNEERDDFYNKLDTPNLSLLQMERLYYHSFLLNEEDRADFPADMVHNLRNTMIFDGEVWRIWTDAFSSWQEKSSAEEVIDLGSCSSRDVWAHRVYIYKNNKRRYKQNCVGEAELARNIAMHINERRQSVKPPAGLLNKCQIGRVVHRVLPNINRKLFDFMWDMDVDMDFKKSLSIFN